MKKPLHENFISYKKQILKHLHYHGLEYGSSWVTSKKTSIGQNRLRWADEKIKQHKIDGHGVYAKLMFKIHPTKKKPCQICGRELYLDYVYPSKNFLKTLNSHFSEFPSFSSIYQIKEMLEKEKKENELLNLLKTYIKKDNHNLITLNEIISELIQESRAGLIKILGPGAMSNFPDRFDGFHSYNRCCRSKEDKGRSSKNLKSYTQDRRAYEGWSDGNHRAANQLMGNKFFSENNLSADHLGPISLGFVHDPRFIIPLSTSDNSSKRDKLLVTDIKKMIEIEDRERTSPASWFCQLIWKRIRYKINSKEITNDTELITFQTILKINKDIFFKILIGILNTKNGKDLLIMFLKCKYHFNNIYEYNYTFNTNIDSFDFGKIETTTKRNITERSSNEENRVIDISINAIKNYAKKNNRRINGLLTKQEESEFTKILSTIKQSQSTETKKQQNVYISLKKLIFKIQKRLLHKFQM